MEDEVYMTMLLKSQILKDIGQQNEIRSDIKLDLATKTGVKECVRDRYEN